MDRYRRAIDASKQVSVAVGRMVWNRVVCPVVLVVRWLLSRIWRLIRPTLIRAWWANRKLSQDTTTPPDGDQSRWQETLRAYPAEQRELAVTTLLSIFESDQDRIRGVESKARGVLQTASLVFAGDAVALNLAVERGFRLVIVVWLVVVSGLYLVAAIGAALYVDKPGERHVLSPDDVLPSERAGATLAVATALNRSASISRTNLTESAIFDVARALVVAAAAVVVGVIAI